MYIHSGLKVYFGPKKKYEQCKSSWSKTATYAFSCKVDYEPKLYITSTMKMCYALAHDMSVVCLTEKTNYTLKSKLTIFFILY